MYVYTNRGFIQRSDTQVLRRRRSKSFPAVRINLRIKYVFNVAKLLPGRDGISNARHNGYAFRFSRSRARFLYARCPPRATNKTAGAASMERRFACTPVKAIARFRNEEGKKIRKTSEPRCIFIIIIHNKTRFAVSPPPIRFVTAALTRRAIPSAPIISQI